MIHSDTLCIQRKVTKFPCFWCFDFRAQFQHFLSAFRCSFFAMQLAFVSVITITPTLSLSVFSWQRRRLFRTCGELRRTRGELWLYFEMQRRLDLWSFSWSSQRSRGAKNPHSLQLGTGRSITVQIPADNFVRAQGHYFSVYFKPNISLERSCPNLNRHFFFANRTRNGRTAAVRSLPTHRFRDRPKTEAALQQSYRSYPKYKKYALLWRH